MAERFYVDCTGLLCPMPILRIRLKLNELSTGDELLARCTDPAFERDLERFCVLSSVTCIGLTKTEYYTDYLFKVSEISHL